MKIGLSQIPEEGLHRALKVDASALPRIREAMGPEAGSLHAELFLKERGGNVEVSGTLTAELKVPCHRCLEPVPLHFEEPIGVTMAPQQRLEERGEETGLSRSDLNVAFFQGDEVDLTELVEDEVLLLLPETVCGEDEQGRCIRCGKTLEELFEQPEDAGEDHPFAQMKRFLE